MSSHIPHQGGAGVLKHDNVIRRVTAHSRKPVQKKWSWIAVCVEKTETEGLLRQLQASAQAEGFQSIYTQSLQPLTPTLKALTRLLTHSH